MTVNPQNTTNEGGEMSFAGAGSFGNVQIDNHQGNLRVHTLASGKQFQVLGGGANFAGTVTADTPTAPTHLTTKSYVDALAG